MQKRMHGPALWAAAVASCELSLAVQRKIGMREVGGVPRRATQSSTIVTSQIVKSHAGAGVALREGDAGQ